MGREIRRVPKGWNHPQNDKCPHLHGIEGHSAAYRARFSRRGDTTEWEYQNGKCYRPCHDESFEEAARSWKAEYAMWETGGHEAKLHDRAGYAVMEFWEYDYPPKRENCRPPFTSPPVCYQVYETVSEGTPVSPVFETLAEVADYLVMCGYSRPAADAFCKTGSALSFIFDAHGVRNGIEALTRPPLPSAAVPPQ